MNESNDEEDSLIFYICTLDYVPVSFSLFTISWLFLAMGYTPPKPQYGYCY